MPKKSKLIEQPETRIKVDGEMLKKLYQTNLNVKQLQDEFGMNRYSFLATEKKIIARISILLEQADTIMGNIKRNNSIVGQIKKIDYKTNEVIL